MHPLPDFHKNAAHTSEYARAFEAQIFASADSRASIAENPCEDQTTKRMSAQCLADPLLRGGSSTRFSSRNSCFRNPACEFTNAPQQEGGIIVQGGAFEF